MVMVVVAVIFAPKLVIRFVESLTLQPLALVTIFVMPKSETGILADKV